MADNYSMILDECDKKINLTKEYIGLTSKLINCTEDEINILLDVRKEVLQNLAGENNSIMELIKNTCKEEQDELKLVINGKPTISKKYSELEEKIHKLMSLKAKGIEKDNELKQVLFKMGDELSKSGNQLAKSKQFIDYLDVDSKKQIYKGSKFDKKL